MKKKKYFLSIAIPTYNRCQLLENSLNNIINNIINKVDLKIEIVVSDNASTDSTQDIMEKLNKKYDFIKYVRNTKNEGIDFNIMQCTQVSSGKFVHLLSDDDILIPDEYIKMIHFLETENCDFLFLNGIGFNYTEDNKLRFNKESIVDFMKKSKLYLSEKEFLLGIDKNTIFKDKSLFIHFIGTYITLVSCFVLKREIWNINKKKDNYIGTDIYLSFDLLNHLKHSQKVALYYDITLGIRQHFSPGNYRVFYAFSKQLNILYTKEAVKLGFDKKLMLNTFKNSLRYDLFGRIVASRFYNPNADKLDKQALQWIISSTYNFYISYFLIYPILFLPKKVYLFIRKIKQMLIG